MCTLLVLAQFYRGVFMLRSDDRNGARKEKCAALERLLTTKVQEVLHTPEIESKLRDAGIQKELMLAALLGAISAAIQRQSRMQVGVVEQQAIKPKILAKNQGYSLLLVPVTLGTEGIVRPYIYGLQSEEADDLLSRGKQEYTLLDFQGKRPINIFESSAQVTESAIGQAKEHFTGRFLSEQNMRGMKI